jgi:hypothetical protein
MCPPNDARLQAKVLIQVPASESSEKIQKYAATECVSNEQDYSPIIEPDAPSDWISYLLMTVIGIITVIYYPWKQNEDPLYVSMETVWYCGWLTAVSTGFGVLPFYFTSKSNKFWTGISNGTH